MCWHVHRNVLIFKCDPPRFWISMYFLLCVCFFVFVFFTALLYPSYDVFKAQQRCSEVYSLFTSPHSSEIFVQIFYHSVELYGGPSRYCSASVRLLWRFAAKLNGGRLFRRRLKGAVGNILTWQRNHVLLSLKKCPATLSSSLREGGLPLASHRVLTVCLSYSVLFWLIRCQQEKTVQPMTKRLTYPWLVYPLLLLLLLLHKR